MVTNPSTLPYKQVCSKCNLSDIYRYPSNGLYLCNLCKVATTCAFDIHINTTIEVVYGPPCISHVKTPWLFPCSNSKKRILWQNILVKKCLYWAPWRFESFWYFPFESNWGTCWIQWEIPTSRSCCKGC